MVNLGDSNCTVYIGDTEVSAIYVGTTQIYPNSTPVTVLTAITLDNLTWVTDIPATGGTATSANCSFTVTGYYSDGTTGNVTSQATITGSLVVASTTSTTRDNVGTLTLTASYDGYTDSSSVSVYQAAATIDYTKEYLTFEIISGGTIYWTAGANASTKTIYYSKDDFVTSTGITSSTGGTAILVNAGDKLKFRASNSTYCDGTSVAYTNRFMTSDVKFNLCGNIMSIVNFNNFTGSTSLSGNYTFLGMFYQQSGLISAENLILPAQTLTQRCYQTMFRDCTSLTKAPELPATTMTANCYTYMFAGCTSLTTAPDLPAISLTQGCYNYMFNGCSSLNYIKCLTRTRLNTTYSNNWVANVAASGTFVKNTGVNLSTGVSGIPQGWTQVIAS